MNGTIVFLFIGVFLSIVIGFFALSFPYKSFHIIRKDGRFKYIKDLLKTSAEISFPVAVVITIVFMLFKI